MPKLTVLTEGIEPTSFELTKEFTSVGRVEGNDIVLPHQSVSGSHGELVLRGEEDVYVRDVGSTNGSYINGNSTDFVNARRTVNGTDRSGHIAGIAQNLMRAL